ncbi:MAG TPA: type VI secretion system baseplate subunit TssK [Gemmatimonadaceae bacterium]|nr:type VI secretion system baseplate subunit TssK [Gemmatimonadaceae bacterium]
MRHLQPVLWTKGVLLTPQHLQTQDRVLDEGLWFRLSTLTSWPWGFHRLEIDREALAGGTFALTAAAGILPDGLLFDIPAGDAPPPPKPLESHWTQDQETLDVHLAIPEYQPGGRNVAAGDRDAHTRYAAELLLLRDENTGRSEKPIQVARKNFRLFAEGESLEGSCALRVARLRRTATGETQLDEGFVPPLIDIGASEHLLTIARRLVEILAARSSALALTRRQKNQSLADFSISDVASFWLLYTINTHFPQLRHLFQTRRGHPQELFAAMTALAGALTTFSTAVHPRDLPTYEHDNLSACFDALDEELRRLLETVVPARSVSLPMRLVQPSVYATALAEDRFLTAPQMYLAVSSDANPAELQRRVPQLVKIGSADRIDHLIRQALPGVGLAHAASPPGAVAVKVTHQYFLLHTSGSEWDAIVRARNLAAYVPADIPGAQLELLVVLPSTGG